MVKKNDFFQKEQKHCNQPKPEHLFHQYRNKAVTKFQLAQFFSRSFETKFHLIFFLFISYLVQPGQAGQRGNKSSSKILFRFFHPSQRLESRFWCWSYSCLSTPDLLLISLRLKVEGLLLPALSPGSPLPLTLPHPFHCCCQSDLILSHLTLKMTICKDTHLEKMKSLPLD